MCLPKSIMNFFTWCNKRVKMLDWFDMDSMNFGSLMVGILLAKLFPSLLSVSWKWYVILVILVFIRPMYKFWFKKDNSK